MRSVRLASLALGLLRRQGPASFARMATHQLRRRFAPSRRALLRDAPDLGDLLGMTTPEEQAFLFRLADRISVIHWGQVIAEGTPDELRGDPWVARAGLGAAV